VHLFKKHAHGRIEQMCVDMGKKGAEARVSLRDGFTEYK
jgi:hypothetical protein